MLKTTSLFVENFQNCAHTDALWDGSTDRQTDQQRDWQTDSTIEWWTDQTAYWRPN